MVRARELPLYSALAVGGGYVWVAHHLLPFVVRVDPVVGEAVDIPVGEKVLDMAFGHGVLWVVTTRTLVRVDPKGPGVRSTTPMDWTGPNAVNGKVADATIGFDGDSVWVAGIFQTAVRRVSPATAEVTATLAVNRSELAMAVGHGSVWVRDGDLVRRLDPGTGTVTTTIEPGGHPEQFRVDRAGLWVQLGENQGSRFVVFDARTGHAKTSVFCARGGSRFQPRGGALWVVAYGQDAGNQSSIRRFEIAARGEVVDIRLDSAAWSLALGDDCLWATTFRNDDFRSRLVRIDERTGVVDQSLDLSVIDLSPYLPAPPEWPPPMPEEIVVFACATCGMQISRRVGALKAPPPIPENEVGEYERLDDWVPVGRYFTELGDTAPMDDLCGAAVVNEADVVNTVQDPDTWRGCCGADGFDGPNLRCRNGHLVALQKSDCMTLNAVWLLPSPVAQPRHRRSGVS